MKASDSFKLVAENEPGYCGGNHIDTVVNDARKMLQATIAALDILIMSTMQKSERNDVFAYSAWVIWDPSLPWFTDVSGGDDPERIKLPGDKGVLKQVSGMLRDTLV